jgi:hypothetical protein
MSAIRRHLFILAPNNSGSTFLARALARSPGAWSLPREGQHMPGFAGPSSRGTGTGLLWAARAERIALFTQTNAFDWDRNRAAWHFHARAQSPDASVLVVQSPPFLLVAEQLVEQFDDARFLIMVRNPYAMVEGIIRSTEGGGEEAKVREASLHVAAVLQWQWINREQQAERSLSFTYEEMCANADDVAARISAFEPGLGATSLAHRISIKGRYDEKLRDMNTEQIARLKPAWLSIINDVFDPHRALIEAFGYNRITP